MALRPIPQHLGRGVFDFEPHPACEDLGYRVEHVGRYHNYHFTTKNWSWPTRVEPQPCVIDGFSPNLNKDLHVGHLRNLMVATSISRIFPNAKMVAMLGAAVGIEDGANDRLQRWYDRAGYAPAVFLDTQLSDLVGEGVLGETDGEGEFAGCQVWNGPRGPVVTRRSDGRPTYAHHDLCLAKLLGPTHYITGAEQREHFDSLGLGDRHRPMGLVLGANGKKLSSREGTALSAKGALALIEEKLGETPDPTSLAWSIMAWNFLRVSRGKNVLFDPDSWINPDTPGMYINYTLARLDSALGDLQGDPNAVTDADVTLLGYCSYLEHYIERAVEQMDPAPIANFLHELAIAVTGVYHAEKIQTGRPGLQFAVRHARATMIRGLGLLGLKPLLRI